MLEATAVVLVHEAPSAGIVSVPLVNFQVAVLSPEIPNTKVLLSTIAAGRLSPELSVVIVEVPIVPPVHVTLTSPDGLVTVTLTSFSL